MEISLMKWSHVRTINDNVLLYIYTYFDAEIFYEIFNMFIFCAIYLFSVYKIESFIYAII